MVLGSSPPSRSQYSRSRGSPQRRSPRPSSSIRPPKTFRSDVSHLQVWLGWIPRILKFPLFNLDMTHMISYDSYHMTHVVALDMSKQIFQETMGNFSMGSPPRNRNSDRKRNFQIFDAAVNDPNFSQGHKRMKFSWVIIDDSSTYLVLRLRFGIIYSRVQSSLLFTKHYVTFIT